MQQNIPIISSRFALIFIKGEYQASDFDSLLSVNLVYISFIW
jgi:hypothetical protein